MSTPTAVILVSVAALVLVSLAATVVRSRHRAASRPGSSPAGQAPTGQAPTGQAPTGQASTGQAPTGRAPLGAVPTQHAATPPTTAAPDRERERDPGRSGQPPQLDPRWQEVVARERVLRDRESHCAQRDQGLTERDLGLTERDQRLTERENRVDVESRHLADRARELAQRHAELEARQADLNSRQDDLNSRHDELTARRDQLADLENERREVLERTAALTADDAKAELVATIAHQARRDGALLARDIEREAHADGELRARRIITGAIQRLATEQTAESVVSVLHLPSDEMKGRIIGREGRNIRAFESVTGVNVIIDDTPEAVLLSCFDPVRREVARVALEALVLDGRIHPQRIEDAHERAKADVEALCVRAGEDALVDVGITDMHTDLVTVLGRLRYRTSYGQNVLKHLLESAHIAAMMASELGLDPVLMRRCALLHDVGKALTHEVEGSHAIVGAELARRYGEHDDVVHAIEAHHNEVEPRTLEAVLTQAADAISGGRPGARRESLEAYVQRLQRLEEIATSYDGVEKVFAMQAGREVRVMVLPDAVDDIQAQVIAREIAKQVEHELTYPGQIRVTVVRESRATEVAR